MTENLGTLVVERPKNAWRDRLRKYQVLVDGDVAGVVGNGGTLTIPIPAGTHQVQAKISWTGSEEIEVEVGLGATVRCRVESAGGPATALDQAMTKAGYLSLSVIGDD